MTPGVYVKGLKDGLGAKGSMIVVEKSYELSDPTDSQMVTLKASGADLFCNITTPKFGAQSIKEAAERGYPSAKGRLVCCVCCKERNHFAFSFDVDLPQ